MTNINGVEKVISNVFDISVTRPKSFNFCQALYPCVWKVSILCLCVLKFKNGHRLTLKSLFTHPPPTMKLFLVLNERYGQNKIFFLQWYDIDFALIIRYHQYCFLWLYIKRQRLSLYDLSQLSVLFFLFVCLSVFSFCQRFFFFSLYSQALNNQMLKLKNGRYIVLLTEITIKYRSLTDW